jgi:hypothetical protein
MAMVNVDQWGQRFFVNVSRSSQAIEFDPGVRWIERLVGNTADSLVLDGLEYGKDDLANDPSVPVRVTVRVDDKGNWKVVEKKPRKE